MRLTRWVGKLVILIVLCAGFAASDSIELRNGRHLQGKYIGGTSSVVGFMTGNTVEYFATTDVLALIFDKNFDSPLGGVRPDPMKGISPTQKSLGTRVNAKTGSGRSQLRLKRTALSTSLD